MADQNYPPSQFTAMLLYSFTKTLSIAYRDTFVAFINIHSTCTWRYLLDRFSFLRVPFDAKEFSSTFYRSLATSFFDFRFVKMIRFAIKVFQFLHRFTRRIVLWVHERNGSKARLILTKWRLNFYQFRNNKRWFVHAAIIVPRNEEKGTKNGGQKNIPFPS